MCEGRVRRHRLTTTLTFPGSHEHRVEKGEPPFSFLNVGSRYQVLWEGSCLFCGYSRVGQSLIQLWADHLSPG